MDSSDWLALNSNTHHENISKINEILNEKLNFSTSTLTNLDGSDQWIELLLLLLYIGLPRSNLTFLLVTFIYPLAIQKLQHVLSCIDRRLSSS
ncbi:unnamed protein product [Rotaria socialis]